MSKTKVFNGTREEHHANRTREVLDQTPVELPLGARQEKGLSIGQQIQQQIAMQIAKKQTGVDQQTPDQIYAELLDLEDNPDAEPVSQYEYTDMHDTLVPGIDIPETAPEQTATPEGVEDPQSGAPHAPEVPPASSEEHAQPI